MLVVGFSAVLLLLLMPFQRGMVAAAEKEEESKGKDCFEADVLWDGEVTDGYNTITMPDDCVSLSLWKVNFGEAGMATISNMLKFNPKLQKLRLMENNFGEAGAFLLADALKANTALITLGLHNNKIGAVGATAISGALEVNSKLTEVVLDRSDIGDVGAAAIMQAWNANKAADRSRHLTMASNGIGDNGATYIAEMLKQNPALSSLSLMNNEIGNRGGTALAGALVTNTNLLELNLLGNDDIDDSIAANIKEALEKNKASAEQEAEKQRHDSDEL